MADLLKYYILDDNKELIPVDLFTWGHWFDERNNQVAKTELNDYVISTVFLGINHAFFPEDKLKIFETMVFNPQGEGVFMSRYSTWNEALEGHMIAVEWVKNGANEND